MTEHPGDRVMFHDPSRSKMVSLLVFMIEWVPTPLFIIDIYSDPDYTSCKYQP